MSYGVRKIMYHSTLRKHVKSLDDIMCGTITPLVRPTHVNEQIFGMYAEELVRRAICPQHTYKYTAEHAAVRKLQRYRSVCNDEYREFVEHVDASRKYYDEYLEDMTKFHMPHLAWETHDSVLSHDITKKLSVVGVPDIVYNDLRGHLWIAEVKHARRVNMSSFLQCYLYACLLQCSTSPLVLADLGAPCDRRIAGIKVYDVMYGRIWTIYFNAKLPMSLEIAEKELKYAVSSYRANSQK